MTLRSRWLAALACWVALPAHADVHYLIVGGLGGEPRYEEAFAEKTAAMAAAARRTTGEDGRVLLLSGADATREAVRQSFAALAERMRPADSLIVFLVGHGSYDGEQYKVNLPGRDLDAEELAELLSAVPARAQLVVNATSASGAVLESWASDSRIVITATRSGWERNATRFAGYFAEALSSEEADLNKNGVVTAQEAFDYAARRVADSFEIEGALATEHPQLAGEGAARFEVASLRAAGSLTPQLAALHEERAAIEDRLEALRLERDSLSSEQYLNRLEALLLDLARVQERIDQAEAE